ncbi:mucin-like protein [Stemphylium lycopersici]|uniref:Mucin-like protein n=1 Tax=Stemphylium lycopersici TaxID=183478 RepID=A0A364NE03_STELY|nr:mucin-like protein [Stemphylium lycopersici]RAR15538.1 mucin-like protein [Stemphylium lycopersici]
MKSKARGTILPLQQAEFDALPDSVQRKYFSSLERLQIQQQAQQAFDEPTSGRSSQASSSKPHLRPLLSLGTERRKRKSEKAVPEHDISHADVGFFLSLPEKVRKQHFSREELLLLQGWREHAFLSDNPESEWAQQRFDDFHFDFSDSSIADFPERGRSRRRLSISSAVSYQHGPSGPFTAQEKGLDSANTPLYLDTMATPIFTRKEIPIADMRRTMSLTAHHVHRGASPLAMSEPPFTNPVPARQHQRAHSSSLSGRRSFQTSTTPVFDPEATHYQDPEARKKLRMYLASPQKFDEAIEFGFPSSAGHDSAAPHYHLPQIHSHSHGFSRDMHTFLRDGQLSFFEDNSNENQGLESDAESVAEMESPATPSSTGLSFHLHSRQIPHRKFSVDSPAPSPVHSANGQLNREMTLRMTLTRPDLRADEDQLYGWQGASSSPKAQKDDPLALEDLVFSDDMTGTKGAFYVKPKPRGNLVSRLLKRASLKSR